jgi:hypothetical protein
LLAQDTIQNLAWTLWPLLSMAGGPATPYLHIWQNFLCNACEYGWNLNLIPDQTKQTSLSGKIRSF